MFGSLARIIVPILSGYLEVYEKTAAFSFALILSGLSLVGIAYYYNKLNDLTVGNEKNKVLQLAQESQKKNSDVIHVINKIPIVIGSIGLVSVLDAIGNK